jgi:biopolymer transport protein TolR
MAMSTGGGGGRGALSEINVTPLVDVMLVLLIVFMVTTPIIVEPLLEACAEYPACLEGFEEKLKVIPTLAEYREGNRLFLLADRGLPYGFVIDVMARMKAAGITNIGMVTNPPAKPGEAP